MGVSASLELCMISVIVSTKRKPPHAKNIPTPTDSPYGLPSLAGAPLCMGLASPFVLTEASEYRHAWQVGCAPPHRLGG